MVLANPGVWARESRVLVDILQAKDTIRLENWGSRGRGEIDFECDAVDADTPLDQSVSRPLCQGQQPYGGGLVPLVLQDPGCGGMTVNLDKQHLGYLQATKSRHWQM